MWVGTARRNHSLCCSDEVTFLAKLKESDVFRFSESIPLRTLPQNSTHHHAFHMHGQNLVLQDYPPGDDVLYGDHPRRPEPGSVFRIKSVCVNTGALVCHLLMWLQIQS